jgi:multidrug resistance protein
VLCRYLHTILGLDHTFAPITSNVPEKHNELTLKREFSRDPARAPSPKPSESEFEIVAFERDDPDNPFNWKRGRKIWILIVIMATVLNSTTGSGLASNAASFIAKDWNITNKPLLILPTSIYLVGYVVGPLVFGPLSETWGRKIIMIWAFIIFTVGMLASALAPNFAALVIFRLITGIGASCALTVSGAVCADLHRLPQARGRAMAFFMAITTFGPCAGPLISGYTSPINWRWSFWVGLIMAGVSAVLLITIPETYAPVILKRRAQRLRKETGKDNIRAPLELERSDLSHIVTVVLTRPVRMFFSEAIIFFCCLYLSTAYSIFYMFFQAFPIIYIKTYGFSYGEEGLAFLPIGVGALIACGMYLIWDNITRIARAKGSKWVQQEEMRRLPLACLGGPFLVIACFWIGWTARPEIHWIVPVLGGIPYGIGFLLVFMSLLNYVVDAYRMFSASAMAATGTTRSICGAVLPFAAGPMYVRLGVPWACSLLGFLTILLAIIPFVFIWKGESLRANSKFCQHLLRLEQEAEAKQQAREQRASKEPIV